MTPKAISKRVIADRLETVRYLLGEIHALPLHDRNAFFADRRNIWAAESCLRRSLEALFDLGRHIMAKAFGLGISEYKELAAKLREQGVLSSDESDILRTLAGYRNRLVHFYHEVSAEELYEICTRQLGDLEAIQAAYRRWVTANPDKLDGAL
jgi:uncharacterized protein YutE (UPF0331/DUF86 family)